MCDDCQQRMAPATARAIEAVTSGTHAAMLAGAGLVHEGLVAITFVVPVTPEESEALRVDLATLVGVGWLDLTLKEILDQAAGGDHGGS